MSRALRFAPLGLLVLIVATMIWRLSTPVDSTVRSRLTGQPVPQFTLPAMLPAKPTLDSGDLGMGSPRLVNIFASWCVPCIAEVRVLKQLHARGVSIDGIAVRDRPEDVAMFLARLGDPYDRIGSDVDSKVQIALGSSGVPESFVVDGRGVIRYQHIGAITAADMPTIMTEMAKAQ